MKLKGLHFADVAEIQEAVTDELKKVQKEEFSAAFQKLYDHAKACIYANAAYFELKKRRVFLMCLRFKKKSVLKLLDHFAKFFPGNFKTVLHFMELFRVMIPKMIFVFEGRKPYKSFDSSTVHPLLNT